ncbi:class I SAM-dependent methyltransferase [Herbaspirillum lusitanum]|uniref:class I SAM-dependent methyltransferase n=1 Tax=Herbaspirillum lusitanum TaxID=213312 RepID=UPI00030CE0EB|nr:class I SAM-dependent methyltransferase [Herbaspirillum lusitanum]
MHLTTEIAAWAVQDTRLLLSVLIALIAIVVLISVLKIAPFLSILLGTFIAGTGGGPPPGSMARADSGCEVWQQNFFELDLPAAFFDGVFANASLFHVPVAELPRVLGQLHATLKPEGVLFCSNPRGSNSEGWSSGRYGSYHDLEAWRGFMTAAGFVEIRHYYRPDGLLRSEQAWLATVWRKPAGTLATVRRS